MARHRRCRRWTTRRRPPPPPTACAYLTGLIARKQAELAAGSLSDDLVSALVAVHDEDEAVSEAERRLSDDELLAMIFLLILAGLELRTAVAGLMAAVGPGSADPDALRVARAGVERARAAFSAALDAAEGKPKRASPEPSLRVEPVRQVAARARHSINGGRTAAHSGLPL
jgi:cytochrome P450